RDKNEINDLISNWPEVNEHSHIIVHNCLNEICNAFDQSEWKDKIDYSLSEIQAVFDKIK
ncbi:hypothetical protein KJ680_12110, partial [bacterium]|nr:hypothetical protein [bacterium]